MKLAAPLLALALAAGCAHQPPAPRAAELFAVIPAASDGHVGTIVVHRDGEERVIHSAYGAQRIGRDGVMQAETLDPARVRAAFATTLAALPGRATHFTLYFLEGRDELTGASKRELDRVMAELRHRPLPDIAVIGHTDSMGSLHYNDRLSRARAERMRQILVSMGLPAQRISVAGRGKRELLVATGNNVPEPRNRRVEIDVR